ncbi:MAG: sugar ABC transporter permease [Devosia sp.]|nr:sugar ABC transporter permease [Devosia sp.]
MNPSAARARRNLLPFAFLAPALAIEAAIILYPVLQTAWMSLHDFVLFHPNNAPFIWLGNFTRAFGDPVFWIALGNSAIWIGFVVGLQFLLGLGTALLLNQSFWWRGLARALVVVPWALPSVIIGLMWTWMYDYNLGIINDLLLRTGLIHEPIAWLARADTTLPSIMLALIWQGFPFFAVSILAGLQTVPQEQLEAAEIDGANAFQRLHSVVLPAIAEVIATVLLLRTIWVANSLDVILVMTGGGPGYASYTLPLYAFLKAYSSMEFGYGAALSLILTALLLFVVYAYVRRTAGSLEK